MLVFLIGFLFCWWYLDLRGEFGCVLLWRKEQNRFWFIHADINNKFVKFKYFWMFSFSSDRQFSFSEWNTTFWPLVNCQSIRKLIMRKLFLALWQKCNSFWCKKSSFIHYLLRQVLFSSFSFNKKKHKPFMDSCQSPHISPWKSQHTAS